MSSTNRNRKYDSGYEKRKKKKKNRRSNSISERGYMFYIAMKNIVEYKLLSYYIIT